MSSTRGSRPRRNGRCGRCAPSGEEEAVEEPLLLTQRKPIG
jgi:hypothetical protein